MNKVLKFIGICFIVAIILEFATIIVLINKKADKVVINNEVTNEDKYTERVKELLADDKEVERKWLINKDNIPYDLNASDVEIFDIKQIYLCFDPEMRVRDYNNGQSYEFTIKTNMSSDGLVRDEVNIEINKKQYNNLVIKQEGKTIHKTRYQFYDNGQVIAIDIFHGDLDGLAYMEIEFANEEESKKYQEPNWVIKDVTSDVRYKNGHLARYGIPE